MELILITLFTIFGFGTYAFWSYRLFINSKKVLERFETHSFEEVHVLFVQTYKFLHGSGSKGGGLFKLRATLYFSDQFIVITPNRYSFFILTATPYWPLVFVKNYVDSSIYHKSIVPSSVKFITRGSINIKYQVIFWGKTNCSAVLRLINKNDLDKIEDLKNWC
jgi:hypothetical protein